MAGSGLYLFECRGDGLDDNREKERHQGVSKVCGPGKCKNETAIY